MTEEINEEIDEGIDEKEAPQEPVSLAKDILGLSPDIPIQMVVVMGRKSISVKDLLDLRMGQVVDLGRAPEEGVELVAAGRVIGKGELVDVEGKLGVRILRLMK